MITEETVSDDDEDLTEGIIADHRKFKCLCNAKNCRDRFISEEEKRKILLAKKMKREKDKQKNKLRNEKRKKQKEIRKRKG